MCLDIGLPAKQHGDYKSPCCFADLPQIYFTFFSYSSSDEKMSRFPNIHGNTAYALHTITSKFELKK